ncbi:SLATT domain-containing protein [Vibrio parahaemolyticus]|uniref:SLATT domain-containing protein n=1 Tax=Vibrio parahaemolyticus TaxID=670 RepID=UPI0003F987E8|nr:SLATT domain-containing protein [Vibrio parahaemolyticus]EGQ7935453.1 SLATT domain-containing protein [Vibrio vulnificus]ELE2041549.1 SLATT domain-containing protein [Vibrio vulnificus]MCR9979795.1 SLATT domain-containing protein [Vibrio parahaemolyticus]
MNQRTQNDGEFKTAEFICVLHSWLNRCRDARDGHYKRAEKLFELSQMLGYVLIYSTVFVTVFSFVSHETTQNFFGINKQHVVVLVGCIAAVISGIVTQARFGERAEMHRSSGARYANLARDIEELQMKMNARLIPDDVLSVQASLIIKEWNNLSEDSLLTPHNKTHSKHALHILIVLSFITMFFFVAI